jgi:site-specific recombinase XerD
MSQDQEVSTIAQRFVGAVAASGDVTVQSTVEWYKTRLKSFLTWARDNQRAALEDTTFNAFVVHLKQRVKVKSLSEHSLPGFYRVLRRFGEWLQAEGYVQADPARALKMPRPDNNQPPRSLTDEEVEKLLAASKVKPREAAMVRCLLHSGARAEELIQLRWGSIRWERNPVGALVQAKGNKMRWIFFAPEAVEALKEYRGCLPSVPEMTSRCGGDVAVETSGDR